MLRPYQLRAIEMLRAQHQNRPLLCLPTGGGKTSVAAEIIRRTVERGNRAIFLVHRRELVDQAVTRLSQFGIEAGRILAGHPEDRNLPVQVASIPTLIRREHWPAELVIVDECSHAVSASWKTVLARYEGSWVIGLTATPIRLDGRGLGDIFGCIVEPVTTRELVEQGFLIEPDVWAPPVDLSGIRVKRGDYDPLQLAERMEKLVGDVVNHWHEHAFGMRTVAFAVNVKHSMSLVERFRAVGVRAEHLDGRMGYAERARKLADLRAGTVDLVSNCMVLSEGWDLPALQCAVLARPTKSLALFRQMVGRVMRPPGPVVVLDHAGNHHEHNSVMDEIAWTLDGYERPTGAAPVRMCKVCFKLIPPPGTVCPECGADSADREEAADVPIPTEAEGNLIRFLGTGTRPKDKRAEYLRLLQRAVERGYKLGWARLQYKQTFDAWPKFYSLERDVYVCPVEGHEWVEKEGWHGGTVVRCAWCCVEDRAGA